MQLLYVLGAPSLIALAVILIIGTVKLYHNTEYF